MYRLRGIYLLIKFNLKGSIMFTWFDSVPSDVFYLFALLVVGVAAWLLAFILIPAALGYVPVWLGVALPAAAASAVAVVSSLVGEA